MKETVELTRDCDAITIPEGQKTQLEKGSKVDIMQALGGTYTVITDRGYMVRIDGKDGDAIGKEVVKGLSEEDIKNTPLEDLIWKQLKTVYDPEIPVDIANLGLIYKCDITDHPEGGKKVYIQMTLTAPGCGMGDTLRLDVQGKVERLPNVKEVVVELVWDPVWDRSMMSDAAKLKLGML